MTQNKNVILAVQFKGLNGVTDVNEILAGSTIEGVDYGDGAAFTATAPCISVLNVGGAYDSYYLLNDAWFDNGTPDGDVKKGWADVNGNLLLDTSFIEGDAMWVMDKTGNGNFTAAGKVEGEDAVEIDIVNRNTLKANVFPMQIKLNDAASVLMSDAEGGHALVGVDYGDGALFTQTAPCISVLNAGGAYDSFYYLNDAWFDNGTPDGDVKKGWADVNGNLLLEGEDVIGAGVGFWINPMTGAFKMTFKR